MTEAEPHVDYYETDRFWNDLPVVVAHETRRLPGRPDQWWHVYTKERYCDPPRARGLVIGCGNGWVERELFDMGLARAFDAFDADPAYLKQCEAERGDRPINYFQADFTHFEPEGHYDLIVNVAALHHATYLHRLCDRLAGALTDDGIFVNWDYVGPDRNQYSNRHVTRLTEVNESLPERLRSPHPFRPFVLDMVTADPTEAVHSSEILSAVSDHFQLIERHDVGGALAYPILWNNVDEFERGDEAAESELDRLLALDAAATDDGSLPVLFSFFIAGPRRQRRPIRARLNRAAREPLRERVAARTRRVYPAQIAELVWDRHLWNPLVWASKWRRRHGRAGEVVGRSGAPLR